MKPNFFIVGTPKAGTTSLYHYLEQHPQIFLSPVKETNFFSYEEIKAQGLFYNEEHISTIQQYLYQFDKVRTEKAIGEASVSYLFYPRIAEKIKQFNPESKIIIVLRNPIDRGFSHYLMDKRLGYTNRSLEDVIHQKGADRKQPLYYQQYIALGLYHEQVARYLSVFGADKVKIFYFEEMVKDIGKTIRDLYRFLEVDDDSTIETYEKHNTFETAKNPIIAKLYTHKRIRTTIKQIMGNEAGSRLKTFFFSKENKPVLPSHLKQELINIYKPDIIKTGELLQKDLSHWLT